MSIGFRVRKDPNGDGYLATLEVPTGPVTTTAVTGKGASKAAAVGRAAGLAGKILNAATKDPIVSALLPPGALPALAVAGKLAKYAKAGKAGAYLKKLRGPGAKRLLSALGR